MSTLSSILHTIVSRMGVSPQEETDLHSKIGELEGAAALGAITAATGGMNVGAGAAMAVKAVAAPMIEEAAGGLVHFVEQRLLGIEPQTALAPLQQALSANRAPPPPAENPEPQEPAAPEVAQPEEAASAAAPAVLEQPAPAIEPPAPAPQPAPQEASTFGALAPAAEPAAPATPLFDAFTGEPLTNPPRFDVFTGKPLGA